MSELSKDVRVKATIKPGAFSGERIFRIALSDGTDEYIGHCDSVYAANGYVSGKLIRRQRNTALVNFPDGSSHQIPIALVEVQKITVEWIPMGSNAK